MAVGGVSQEWFTAAELAEFGLPGLATSKRGVKLQAGREGWDLKVCGAGRPLSRKRQARGGGIEYHQSILPADARAKLTFAAAAAEKPDRQTAWDRYDRLPSAMKEEAERRLTAVTRVEALVQSGQRKAAAIGLVVAEGRRKSQGAEGKAPFSERTVHGWFQRIAGVEPADRLAYLAPEYTGRQATADCSPEAWEFFKGDSLRPSGLSDAGCYRNLQRQADKHGWTIPSLKTLRRRLDIEVPPAQQVFLRQGAAALLHAYPHKTRDRSTLTPMQVVNLDGHTFDVFVEWPGGTISRPHCLAVQDIASGKVLALRFDITLNHHLVRLALGDTFREFGLAERVLMDNGSENRAAAISGGQERRWTKTPAEEPLGLLATLGIKADFAKPRWGQAKPIERAFRNFAHDIAKQAAFDGAYTGHNPMAKPENYKKRAIPFAEFERIVREQLKFYNDQPGRRGLGMNGRSFDQAFADGMQGRTPRTVTAEQLRACMLASRPVQMDRLSGAVTVEGHSYWSPALGDLKRQKVTVRFDPERMDQPAHIYAADGRYLCEAKRQTAGSFDNLADGREHGKALRDWARSQRDAARAARRLTAKDVAAMQQTLTPPVPPAIEQGNLVRPAFGAPRSAAEIGALTPQPASEPVIDFDAKWARGFAKTQEAG